MHATILIYLVFVIIIIIDKHISEFPLYLGTYSWSEGSGNIGTSVLNALSGTTVSPWQLPKIWEQGLVCILFKIIAVDSRRHSFLPLFHHMRKQESLDQWVTLHQAELNLFTEWYEKLKDIFLTSLKNKQIVELQWGSVQIYRVDFLLILKIASAILPIMAFIMLRFACFMPNLLRI